MGSFLRFLFNSNKLDFFVAYVTRAGGRAVSRGYEIRHDTLLLISRLRASEAVLFREFLIMVNRIMPGSYVLEDPIFPTKHDILRAAASAKRGYYAAARSLKPLYEAHASYLFQNKQYGSRFFLNFVEPALVDFPRLMSVVLGGLDGSPYSHPVRLYHQIVFNCSIEEAPFARLMGMTPRPAYS